MGIDSDGALAALYKVASCPQVTFAYPGGEVQSGALLGATLAGHAARARSRARHGRAGARMEAGRGRPG